MREFTLKTLAAAAVLIAASLSPAAAGGWGYGGGYGYNGGYGYGGGYGGYGGWGTGCGRCGGGGVVAVQSYAPVTTYTARTVYAAHTAYVPSISYRPVAYQQAYVVDQGPVYRPALTGYRYAHYTYDAPRRHRYVGGPAYRYHHAQAPRYGYSAPRYRARTLDGGHRRLGDPGFK